MTVLATDIRKGDVYQRFWFVYTVRRVDDMVIISIYRKHARSCVWRDVEYRAFDMVEVSR